MFYFIHILTKLWIPAEKTKHTNTGVQRVYSSLKLFKRPPDISEKYLKEISTRLTGFVSHNVQHLAVGFIHGVFSNGSQVVDGSIHVVIHNTLD